MCKFKNWKIVGPKENGGNKLYILKNGKCEKNVLTFFFRLVSSHH